MVVPWDAPPPPPTLLTANIRRTFDDDAQVQVVVPWDAQLKLSLVYEPAFDIFSGKGHKSPPLNTKRDMLLNIVSRPSEEYFLSGTSQDTNFEKLKKQSYAGWTSVSGRNRVWTMTYTAEKLALLLVLREQVDSEKKVRASSCVGGASATKCYCYLNNCRGHQAGYGCSFCVRKHGRPFRLGGQRIY